MSDEKAGALKRFLRFLGRPSARYSLICLLAVGFVSGIIFWGGRVQYRPGGDQLAGVLHLLSRDARHRVPGVRQTVHYQNRSGVRATCPDCHVPRDWTHKVARKMKASFEIWGKLTGVVDTPEKFEANRMRLTTDELARMEGAKSRECLNCHNFAAMDPERQKSTATKNQRQAQHDGKTCIDCHKGIAHKLPKEYQGNDED